MTDVVYEDVVKLAEQLSLDEQNHLIAHLHAIQLARRADSGVSAPQTPRLVSLYGKFANPSAPDLSANNLHAQLHAISTEWEHELDELRNRVDQLTETEKSEWRKRLIEMGSYRPLTNEERALLLEVSISDLPIANQSVRREDWYNDDGR